MSSEVVANNGSVARDHLANERTFLAWLRTALGLVGLGVLLARLEEPSRGAVSWAGLSLIAFGALSLVYALARYVRVARHLQQGTFPIAKQGPMLIGIGALLVTAFAVVYLVG